MKPLSLCVFVLLHCMSLIMVTEASNDIKHNVSIAESSLPLQQTSAFPTSIVQTSEEAVEPKPGATKSQQDTRKRKKPWLELHGEARYIYGEGRFDIDTDVQTPFGKRHVHQYSKLILPQHRIRLEPTLHLSDSWRLTGMLEDSRDHHDSSNNRHAYLKRLYMQHDAGSVQYTFGRFNQFMNDGNIIDEQLDGIRVNLKPHKGFSASLAYGRTHKPHNWQQKTGLLAEVAYQRLDSRWNHKLEYLNMRATGAVHESFIMPGTNLYAEEDRFRRQEIWSLYNSYDFTPHLRGSVELLRSTGWRAEGAAERDYGWVGTLLIHYVHQPNKLGDWDVWIRYYCQPSSSYITHTMDAQPTFFNNYAGFKGWCARYEVVVSKGLVLILEGFYLNNRHDRGLHQTERVLGFSLTQVF